MRDTSHGETASTAFVRLRDVKMGRPREPGTRELPVPSAVRTFNKTKALFGDFQPTTLYETTWISLDGMCGSAGSTVDHGLAGRIPSFASRCANRLIQGLTC
jgi:hypothetical protein